MAKIWQKALFGVCFAVFCWSSTPVQATPSQVFLEYQVRNSTGQHYSPAALYNFKKDKFNIDIGIHARMRSSALNVLTYLLGFNWTPTSWFFFNLGFYHKDYFHIDVGEDLVFFGPGFKIGTFERSYFSIYGGFNYRTFRIRGPENIPFSFTGDGREYNYYTVMEHVTGFSAFDWRLAFTDKDTFTVYRFQSFAVDTTFTFHGGAGSGPEGGGSGAKFFAGAEIRFAGMFIGAATINHVRFYGGIKF